jgi:hypothetical protein
VTFTEPDLPRRPIKALDQGEEREASGNGSRGGIVPLDKQLDVRFRG